MKYTNVKAFEKHLESASPQHLSPLYLILIKDPFICKTMTDRLVSTLLSQVNHPEFCLKSFEGQNVTETQLSELSESSFFSNKQIFRINQADTIPKGTQKLLEEYFVNPNPANFLILSAPTLNRTTNFYKKAEKAGIVLELEEEKGAAKEKTAMEWIHLLVMERGKKIAPQTVQYLVKQLGPDISLLNQEIEKLICFIGDRPEITVKDISEVCISVNIETIWQLGEAIFTRNAPMALRISKALLADGIALIALIRQIRSQLQTDFQVFSILASGGTNEDLSKKFPYMKGFILDRHKKMAQEYGLTRFVKGMKKIDEIELIAKNSSTDENLLAELLIINLVT